MSMMFSARSTSTILLLFLCLRCERGAHAWGKQGHEIVGNLAWTLLSEPTRGVVTRLLHETEQGYCTEYCSPLAQVADWADRARYSTEYHWSGPLHYIDVHDDWIPGGCPAAVNSTATTTTTTAVCQFNYTRDCKDDFCVAGAIVNYTSRLESNNNDDEVHDLRRESLMFLVHYIGDIHQPLHCSRTTDRGGNSIHVTFLNHSQSAAAPRDYHRFEQGRKNRLGSQRHHHSPLNLHAVWDDTIIETTLARDYNNSRNVMELHLLNFIWKTRQTDAWKNQWLACANGGLVQCTTSWGQESWKHAIADAYRNVDGTDIKDGTVLTEEYYETRLLVVRERLAVAGVRLASTLELIFGGDDEPNNALLFQTS